jgi:hypothetical protein
MSVWYRAVRTNLGHQKAYTTVKVPIIRFLKSRFISAPVGSSIIYRVARNSSLFFTVFALFVIITLSDRARTGDNRPQRLTASAVNFSFDAISWVERANHPRHRHNNAHFQGI